MTGQPRGHDGRYGETPKRDPGQLNLEPPDREQRALASMRTVGRDVGEVASAGRDAFFADTPDGRMRRHAAVRLIVVFAEASKDISPQYKAQHAGLDWKGLRAMRDKTSHKYDGVNDRIVWNAITRDIPHMLRQLGLDTP